MRQARKSGSTHVQGTLPDIIREHNTLNGLRLVTIEFALVAFAALLILSSGLLHARPLTAVAGMGIFVNACAVIAIAITQLRHHDRNEGLLKIRTPEFRAKLRQQHPNLSAHSVIVMVSVLTPFLLVALLSFQMSRR